MDRVLTAMIYAYLGLAVAHWNSVARLLHDRSTRLWCGNVITDPHYLLMNRMAPFLIVCIITLLVRRIPGRRRPYLPLLALPLFLGTTAGLLSEAYYLRDYGLWFHVWWFPWLGHP